MMDNNESNKMSQRLIKPLVLKIFDMPVSKVLKFIVEVDHQNHLRFIIEIIEYFSNLSTFT